MKYRPRKRGSQGVRHLQHPCGKAIVTVLVATTLVPPQFAMPAAYAQSSSSSTPPRASTSGTLSPAQLDQLVARIALYSDPLLAILLPASTQTTEIVEAKRFLEQHATNPSATPSSTWAPSVVSLLNYPDVIRMMDSDLDWTQQLGDAVITQQQDVMAAIQRFRAQAYAAGNLTSNNRVQVTVQNGAAATPASTPPPSRGAPVSQVVTPAPAAPVIQIQSASPTLLYVPQYDPAVVVRPVPVGGPPPFAYSPPYPAYISTAAPFFTGAVFGAAVGFGVSWASGSIFSGALGGGGNVTNVNINNINNHFNTFEHNGANIWHPDSTAVMNANNHGMPPNNAPNPGGLLYGAHNPPSGSQNNPQSQTPSTHPSATENRPSPGTNPSSSSAEGRPSSQAGNAANRGENPQNGGENRSANQGGAAASRGRNPRSGGENRQNADQARGRSMANAAAGGEIRGGGAFSGVDQPRSQAERAQARGNASLHRANSGPPRGARQAGNVHPANERRR